MVHAVMQVLLRLEAVEVASEVVHSLPLLLEDERLYVPILCATLSTLAAMTSKTLAVLSYDG